jgi:hypothetical protein
MKNEMLRHLKALWIYIVGVIVFTIFTIVGLSLLSGDMSIFDLLYGALVAATVMSSLALVRAWYLSKK